jgi:hypothetical protein
MKTLSCYFCDKIKVLNLTKGRVSDEMSIFKDREVCQVIYEKYNLPKQISAKETEGKIVDYIINGDEFVYVVFKDNTLTVITSESDSTSLFLDYAISHVDLLIDFKEKFPDAHNEYHEQSALNSKAEERERKMKMYEKLKQELGM